MREFRTWKRYHGGRAQDVWIYDLAANTSERITDYDGTDNQPVWLGDTIYFTSDRGANQKLNLWAHDVRTRKQRAGHDPRPLRRALAERRPGGRRLRERRLHLPLRSRDGQSTRVDIRVAGDLRKHGPDDEKREERDPVDGALADRQARALRSARRRLHGAGEGRGDPQPHLHARHPRDGARPGRPTAAGSRTSPIASGEYEIYVRPADGSGEERRVTTDGNTWRFPPSWSPDSKLLAYADKSQRLRVVTVATGATVDVDRGRYGDLTTYRWSPDSRWLAYVKQPESTRLSAIWVYSIEDGKPQQLTSGNAADSEPVFDPLGRYLYFLSNRDFRLTFSGFEFNYVYTDPTRVYVGVLSKTGPALFLPQSDEEPQRDDEALRPPAPPGRQPPSVPKPPPPEASRPGREAGAAEAGANAERDDTPAAGRRRSPRRRRPALTCIRRPR